MSKRHITKSQPTYPTIPVKRRPARQDLLRKLFALPRRKQRATTATAEELEDEDRGLKISRGFTIIFAFHIVAIGLYFVHLNFLNDHTTAPAKATATPAAATASKPRTQSGAPLISPDDKTCKVRTGDNYALIAAREGVLVDDLRAANGDRPLSADLTLILPQKHHSAGYPPAIQALRNPPQADSNNGLVVAVPADSTAVPRGILVRPKVVREPINSPKPTPKASTATSPKASPKATGRSYVVKPGDSLWQISKRFKVDEVALMRANSITDPKKLKTGTALKIPQ